MVNTNNPTAHSTNFIRNIIDKDIENHNHQGRVVTRFPPEPNGYLHIGHAKSICLNFALAYDYQRGPCHLRFDDTNPLNAKIHYINAIKEDIQWLGFDWQQHEYYASGHFDKLYECAKYLIKQGKAYVCSLTPQKIREYRGTLTEAGINSPYRERSIEKNLDLFERMKKGEFEEGSHCLRAKIDMASGNINLRDPAIYRIKHINHPLTENQWCIYPMYDFAHAISDAIEGITHSLCTLEFQDHRPLYDWFVHHCAMRSVPHQYEFARLNLNYTVTSKRKLKQLIDEQYVESWDDPRMPTLSGLRRRGVPPEAIRKLCNQLGVSKQESVIDYSLFDECIRDELNQKAPRRMAVVNPLKVRLINFNGPVEWLNVPNHPQNQAFGRRDIPISSEIYIDRDDFAETPPSGFKRLKKGGWVRLMNAYVIQFHKAIYDDNGKIKEIECYYLPETLGGKKPSKGGKVKGIIQWVDAREHVNITIRQYDRLFNTPRPDLFNDITKAINPDSLKIIKQAKGEINLKNIKPGLPFQFLRVGYFTCDKHCTDEKPTLNRITTLKDRWMQNNN